jgi:hypothetical protein
MRLRLTKIGDHPAVTYALEEVAKYIHRMDRTLAIDEFSADDYKTIADIIGKSESAVKMRVKKGRELFLENYKKENGSK